MKSLLTPCNLQTRPRLAKGIAALLTAAAVGCASPGPPRAPSLNLPEIVKDLTAERTGDVVELHWDTSAKTTDRIDIKGSVTAEICRLSIPAATLASASSPPCTPVKRLQVHSGPSQASEILPQALTVDPTVLLAYRVQLFNSNARSAGLSPKAFVAAGAAPPPVEQLRVTAVREGAMLEWRSTDTTTAVELDRRLIGPGGIVAASAPAKTSSSAVPKISNKTKKSLTSGASSKPHAQPISPVTQAEVKLQTPRQASDVGGTLDQTTHIGESYSYTAQRVRSVSFGGHSLELRSLVSSPVIFVARDIFPPLVPTGLEAVPGGATPADRSIDLSWTPNTDADLAGYSVYRQEVTSNGEVAATAARLNSTPVVGPAYRDQTAIPGHRYAYRVTAVDAAGNESAPSAAVQETLREP